MAVSSYTGRQDPFAAYEQKPAKKPKSNDIFAGLDLDALEAELQAADIGEPEMPPPVAGPQPAAMPETETEKVARVREDLFAEPEDEDSQFTKGAIAGTQQMLGLYGAAKATFGSLIDSPEMVNEGLSYYQEKMREAEKFSPNVSGIEEVDLLDEGGMERLGDYLGYTFGNVLPSMAISIGTGGVTGLAAGTAARYLGKEGAQEALDALAKKQLKDQSELSTALKKLKLKPDDFDVEANERLQELIREDMSGVVAREAAARAKQDYISAQAFKYGLVGSGAQSVVLNTGETFGEIYERTGEEAPVTAITAGLASGALDTFATPLRVAKALTPDMLDPMRDHLSKEALRLQDKIQNVLVEVGKTSGIEGMTEATQAMITEMAVTFVNNNYTDEQRIAYLDALSSEETKSKILNSAAAGVVGGFGVSATTQAVAEGVNQLRGREPQGDVRQQLIDDRLARMDAIRQSVREIVDAEFTEVNEAGLPAPDAAPEPAVQEPAPVAEPTSQTESRFDEVTMDTLRLIGSTEGITEQELVEATGLPMERQQQVISDLFTEGAIDVMVDGNRTTFAITDEGTFDLYPPEFEEQELPDLPPIDVTPAATTTIETDAGTETIQQTLEEFRGQVQEEVAEPEAPTRREPIVSAPTGEPVPATGMREPRVSAATDTTPIEEDRRTPIVTPVTDANRVIERPKVERTSELGGGFKVTYPGSRNEYLIKQYAQDAGGGFYLVADGKTTDLADTLDDSVKALEATERQALSTGAPVESEVVQPDPVQTDDVAQAPAPTPEPDVEQLPEVTRPTLKRYRPSGPVQEGTNQFQITFPDSNNQYIVEEELDPSSEEKDGTFFVDAETGVTLGYSRSEMVETLELKERRLAAEAPTPAGRVTDPAGDPVVKKDADFRETGNYLVAYPDGDVRQMFFNSENPRAWFDSETVNSGSAGDISTGVLGYNKTEALARLKEIRQQEFDQQTTQTPDTASDIRITAGIRSEVFPGIPDLANRAGGSLTASDKSAPTISNRLTKINLAENKQVQMGNTGDTFSQQPFGSMSRLFRHLEGQGSVASPLVSPDGSDQLVRMKVMLDEYRGNLGTAMEDSPEVSQYVNTLLDMVERGMPIDFVTNTNGVYINPHRKNVSGSFYPSSFAISINPELLSAAAKDASERARLMHVVAHEHWHLADEVNSYSKNIPELGIKPANPDIEIDPVFQTIDLELGDIAGGLFDQWAQGTELGQEFHYPFRSLGNVIADEVQSTDSAPLQERVSNVLRTFEKEVFAQAGAVFIGKPDLLKAESPEAYNLFRAIQKQPKLTAGQLNYGQDTTISREERESGGSEVPGDFRSRSSNRSVQIPVSGRGGQDSGGRSVGGQGLSSVEGSPPDGDGDASGRGLRETPALDVREDQKYLYQKPRGKVRGKSAINKTLTTANSAQQLQLLSELVARHPNVLDSAAKYTAFEKDLTGGSLQVKTADGNTKETLVLRPPHYLIKLYNDMDLWVETHSKLRGEQLAAASAGLETARKMGKLYADGDATPATTAKLMLWGMLSRMLTASAQESAFVDLMTKLPGQDFDPVNNLVEKALTGSFTDETVTVTVVTDKSKGTTKEVTMNRDVAEWRESVADMIPEGSFGKAGTSNANDFGNFMLKMSEMDGNQSKLARLHDLVSDRSISTARVRQEFQSMMGGAGIDNKVFSFLMLMTGRDDVVILDRIQLNTMWDTGRYGKLIYDDIAENFSSLHGLARYEVLENALKLKIVELYTLLGRPQDASVGRYHWESWVLNSGQVVAHPTMQGLVADIMGAPNPYAFMGAPEGKQNMYRYGAIYARDDQGQPYYLYSDSKGTPYKLDREQFGNFISEIQKPKNGIVPRNFKVSEYDEGFPWYEADGVDRAKLDEVLEANAERKATEREYAVEGDVRNEGQTDGAGQGLEPTPALDIGAGFRGATEQLGTRNQLVADLEKVGIPQGELVADITDADLDAMSPDSKRLLKALQNDDWLGFDNIDDLLVTIFDEGLDGYDTSISTRIALGRYVNQNYGGVSSVLDMVGDNPNKDPSSKFNEQDAVDIVKDLQYRLEKILPFYKNLMDQYVDMKQLERQIAANRGLERLPAAESFYDAENLMHGKAAYELDLVQKNYLEPIKDILSEEKIDVEGLGKYLLAKHAPERNVVIAQKALEKREKLVAQAEAAENQRVLDYFAETPVPFQDYETEQGGSGISNQEAIEILAIAERDGLTETMDKAAQYIYDMLKEHRDRMIKNQLLDFETVEDWEAQYQFYVPLKGFAAEENIQADYSMSDKTRGFSIMGSESLKAKGRTTLPANPVIISILDVAAKIKRGEKNNVANVLLDMLYKSGFETDPEAAEAQNSAPFRIWNNKQRPDDPATQGSTKLSLQQMDRATNPDGSPRYLRVKRGGQTFYIQFTDTKLNETMQKLGESPFNSSSAAYGKFATYANRFQSFRRDMLINYNPVWGISNPIKDVTTAIFYTMSESGAKGSRTQGKDVTAGMVRNYPNALRAYWRHLRETEGRGRAVTDSGKRKQIQYDTYVKEYFEDGAPTGMILTRTYEEEVRAIENDIKGGNVRAALKAMGKFVEDFNQTMENAARVSAYVEARKAGAPRANAATLAKDLTVNFNRKGENNPTANLLWLFFNAAQQGTLNFAQAVGRHSKKIPAAMAGLFGAGYSITVYNILNSPMDENEDDDEPFRGKLSTAEFIARDLVGEVPNRKDVMQTTYADYSDSQLKRSINITREDGTMVSIPLAYGFQFIYNGGRVMAEWQYGLIDAGEATNQIAQSFIDNFSPFDTAEGEGPEELRGLAPDLIALWLDLTANRDYFGNPIQREQFPTEPKKAQAYVTKRSTSKISKDIMQRLNDLDGSEYRSNESMFYPEHYLSPDRVDYMAAWLMGGVGRFIGDLSDVAYKAATDPGAIELTDYPVVGQFYKEPSEYADQSEFYENAEVFESRREELRTAKPKERLRLLQSEGRAYYSMTLESIYEDSSRLLKEIRKSERMAERFIAEPDKLRLQLQKLDDKKQRAFDKFNKAFRAAKKKAGD